jgi:hypothetical protein
MFHEVVKSLGIINAWFSEHQKVIEGVARGIGDALGDAFARGREQLTIFAHRLNDLADSPAFRRFAGMVTGAGHAIGAAMQNGGTRAAVAGGAVGLMAGIPGLGVLAGGLYSFVTQHEKAFDETLMHLGAALMSLAPVVTALWETFAVAEEFLGSLFAAVLPGLSAGIAAIVSGISYYYTAIITAAEGIWNQVSPAILALGSALGNLFSAVGSVLGPTMIILTQQFISVATTIATTVIPMFVRFVTAIGAIVNWIADHLRMVGVEIGNWTPGAAVAGGRSGDTKDTDIFKNMRDAINSIYRPEDQNKNGRLGDGRNRDQAHLQAQAPGRTNVNVQITQTINDASDPDRVMIDTRKAIYQSLFHPIESHGTAVLR